MEELYKYAKGRLMRNRCRFPLVQMLFLGYNKSIDFYLKSSDTIQCWLTEGAIT